MAKRRIGYASDAFIDDRDSAGTECASQVTARRGEEHTYVHPVKVTVNRGGEITTIDEDGTQVEQGEIPPYGVTIDILFHGEEGERFCLAFEFAKGNTFAYIERFRKSVACSDDHCKTIYHG